MTFFFRKQCSLFDKLWYNICTKKRRRGRHKMTKVIRDVFQDFNNEGSILEATITKINLYKKSNKLEIEIFSRKSANC